MYSKTRLSAVSAYLGLVPNLGEWMEFKILYRPTKVLR